MDKGKIDIRDPKGNQINLSTHQKNALYKRARDLKNDTIKPALLSKTQCWKPTNENVNLMLNREEKVKKQKEEYSKIMRSLGADPREVSVEQMRRGR